MDRYVIQISQYNRTIKRWCDFGILPISCENQYLATVQIRTMVKSLEKKRYVLFQSITDITERVRNFRLNVNTGPLHFEIMREGSMRHLESLM